MPQTSFSQWALYFVAYSALGWAGESLVFSLKTRKLVNRGFLRGPWIPSYGFGAILILLCTAPLQNQPLLVFPVILGCVSALEYAVNWLFETLFKTRWWDYTHRRFHLNGRISLVQSLLFTAFGAAALYALQPLLQQSLAAYQPRTLRVLASIFIALLFADLLNSLATATSLVERLSQLKELLNELAAMQKEHDWYDPANSTASIDKLRDLCQKDSQNTKATLVLEKLEHYLSEQKKKNRLVQAFPLMRPLGYKAELEALQAQWAAHRAALRQKQRTWLEEKSATYQLKKQANRLLVKNAYKEVTFTRLVWVFLVGCVIGYIVETIYCFLWSGTLESRQGLLYGPFSQVYGLGAILLVLMLTPFTIKGDRAIFIVGALAGGAFEALCSLVQEVVFGSVSWDYSKHQTSILGGRTNLLYMCFWGILSVVYMKNIYPYLASLIDRIPIRPKRFFTWAITVFLIVDMALSAAAVIRWEKRLRQVPPANAVEKWLDHTYPDQFLKEIYPGMVFRQ